MIDIKHLLFSATFPIPPVLLWLKWAKAVLDQVLMQGKEGLKMLQIKGLLCF